MTQAERFLTSLAQALSTASLYGPDHPLRSRVLDQGYVRLRDLCHASSEPVFTLLDDDVLFEGRPLRTFRAWMWADRLSAAGVQRIEIAGSPSRKDYGAFVEDLCGRLRGGGQGGEGIRRVAGFRYGSVGLASDEDGALPSVVDGASGGDASPSMGFLDEAAALDWALDEVRQGRELQMLEVDLVVRALGAAMRGGVDFLIPVLRLEDYDAFTTVHSLNVSIVAMAFGEFLGLDRRQIHLLGVGGALHDLGKIRIPTEVLEKSSDHTDDEWALIRAHPVDGARMILASDERLELPAVVAYEHHMTFDGGGYPRTARPRRCHPLSHVIQLCDVYDTLSAPRPYRDAMARPDIVKTLERGAGRAFDPHLSHGFRRMLAEWADRLRVVDERKAEPVPAGG